MRRETWKIIPQYPNYEASSQGRVRNKRGLIRKPTSNQQLTMRGEKEKCESIGRLVLMAFVGPPTKKKPWALHCDDNRANNELTNLYWGSPKENTAEAIRNRGGHWHVGTTWSDSKKKAFSRKMRRAWQNGSYDDRDTSGNARRGWKTRRQAEARA